MSPQISLSLPLTLITVLFMSSNVHAETATVEGTEVVIEFTASAVINGRSDITTSSINHVLKGKCLVRAGTVGAFGIDGPTKAQEKILPKANAAMLNMEKEAGKCKGNQACLMQLAMKMAGTDMGSGVESSGDEAAIQVWYPQSCSGSFTADDKFTTNDPGGEGGGGAYQSTSTVQGSATIPEGGEDGWLGWYIESDLGKTTTQYRFNEAPGVPLERKTQRTGYKAGATTDKIPVSLLGVTTPNPWGPFQGPIQAGKEVKKISGGTLTLEWSIVK